MQVLVDLELDQLIKVVKKLPPTQLSKLKEEIEKDQLSKTSKQDLETFLLAAPTFSKKQIDAIAKTRKQINQWRTKEF